MKLDVWQILDVGSIWMKEFAHAMGKEVPIVAWCPEMSAVGAVQNWQKVRTISHPPLDVTYFPLQRGYARTPIRQLAQFEVPLVERMARRSADPASSPLICTTPFYAPVAERWPGPTIYYATDLTVEYASINSKQVVELDKRMCAVADAVCPNSRRIAGYLIDTAGCDPAKITIVPNATRQTNLASAPLMEAEKLPSDLEHLPRPIAGVIGNLAGNMDWVLLADAYRRTKSFLSWVFVGPTSTPVMEKDQAAAREWLMERSHFTGAKPYGDLQRYARCFDVAVLPYKKKEPTYSGSSTRFYEHLAACRPMVSTRGFAELLEKEPLLRLVDTGAEMAAALEELHSMEYHDGLEPIRWEASRSGTWEDRARTLVATISEAPSEHVPVMMTGSY
jgi:glycosyltransferase involved in cell wall biosynthesis